MLCFRKMRRISGTLKLSNERVLKICNVKRCLKIHPKATITVSGPCDDESRARTSFTDRQDIRHQSWWKTGRLMSQFQRFASHLIQMTHTAEERECLQGEQARQLKKCKGFPKCTSLRLPSIFVVFSLLHYAACSVPFLLSRQSLGCISDQLEHCFRHRIHCVRIMMRTKSIMQMMLNSINFTNVVQPKPLIRFSSTSVESARYLNVVFPN